MDKFRKKTVEVEAVQFNAENRELIDARLDVHPFNRGNTNFYIETSDTEGRQLEDGDWILDGIGDYPEVLTDSTFKATYEAVE